MTDKLKQLKDLLLTYVQEDICLAFSGGVDSSLLLKLACDAAAFTGKKVYAVTFDTKLHPSCDLENAVRVAEELGGIHHIISVDELEQDAIRNNPINRCYLCKQFLFRTLQAFASTKGITHILDGTNEDDLHVYRPGIQALSELGIKSPLATIHVTKAEVTDWARDYQISAASRPSTPCMATRIPYDTKIDYDILDRISRGEAYIRTFINGNIRLRLHGEVVRIEVDSAEFEKLLANRQQLLEALRSMGFRYITMDLGGFRSGSMDVAFIKSDTAMHYK